MIAETTEIWKVFGDRLRRYIRKSIRNESDAEDVLQDVFARLHSGVHEVRDAAKLEAWIFQVTRFAIIDHIRARTGKKQPQELPDELIEEPPSPDASAEVASWLMPLMNGLSPEDREALVLTAQEGVSQAELAKRLGLSATGARSRVQRARGRLKQLLLDCCHVELDRRKNAIAYTRRHSTCNGCSCE